MRSLLSCVFWLVIAASASFCASQNPYRIVTVAGGDTSVLDGTRNQSPSSIALDARGNLWIADPAAGSLTVIPRSLARGRNGRLLVPESIPSASAVIENGRGGFYIADAANHRIVSRGADGVLLTVVGTGLPGFNGDHAGTATQIDSPSALAIDAAGGLYFADTGNSRIRKLMTNGDVATLNAGPLNAGPLNAPQGLAVDDRGNVFISDTGNHRIVMIGADGERAVLAGGSSAGFSGDGGDAAEAQLSAPLGLFLDPITHDLYVADSGNHRVRRLRPDPAIRIVNAATLRPGPVAACSLAVIFARNVGAEGVQILFDGRPAVTKGRSGDEITAELPCPDEPQNSTELSIHYPDADAIAVSVPLASVAPGLFSVADGVGQAIATNADGTLNSESNPTNAGSTVVLWATGVKPSEAVEITFGANAGAVLKSSSAPGLSGVTQFDVQLPSDVFGTRDIVLRAGGRESQPGLTLTVAEGVHERQSPDVTRSPAQAATDPKTFTLSASPAILYFPAGGTVSVTVTVSSPSGYKGTVTPTVKGALPSGVTATACSPASIKTSGSCVITIKAAGTAPSSGPANITISGTDGSTVKTVNVSLTVVSTQPAGASAAASIDVTVSSMPATGANVNLSAATRDWRLFTQPAPPCQSFSECYGDRRLNGAGIMGVHTLSTDPNYLYLSSPASALSFSYTDGTTASSGTGKNYMYYANQSYAIRAIADNAVVKTLTIYWAMINYYQSTRTKSGDETATFTFALSDGSAATQTKTVTTTAAAENGLIKMVVSYRSAKDGQELIVTGTRSNSSLDSNAALTPLAVLLDSAPTGPITRNIPMGADLQAEMNGMARDSVTSGDVQLFPAGYSWTGNFVVPANKGITMRVAGQTVPNGKRIATTEARATLSEAIGSPVVSIGPGVRNFTMDGFEIKESGFTNYALIVAGVPPGNTSPPLASLPQDIDLGHLYVHCEPVTLTGVTAKFNSNCRAGAILDGNRISLHDSVVKNIIWNNIEANAFRVSIGQHVTVLNNELMSNGEIGIIHTAGGYVGNTTGLRTGLFANDFLISGNWMHKDPAWLHTGFEKNMMEVKNGRNGVISNNLIEDSFTGTSTDGQYGYGILIANRTAGSSARDRNDFSQPATFFASTQNIEVKQNIMRRMGSAFVVQGPYDDQYCYYLPDPGAACNSIYANIVAGVESLGLSASLGVARGTNWNIHDNYVENLNPLYGMFPGTDTLYSGAHKANCLLGSGADAFTFSHNECRFDNHGLVGSTMAAGTYAGFPYKAHVITRIDNSGWDTLNGLNNYTTGTVINGNIFGWEIGGTCTDGLPIMIGGCGGSTADYKRRTFTNNNVQNSFADWTKNLATANGVAPGQYTGNTINVPASASQGVTGGAAALLAGEAAIRAGNR